MFRNILRVVFLKLAMKLKPPNVKVVMR